MQPMREPSTKQRRRPSRGLRGVWFRVGAIIVGLSPLLLLEAALRLGGWHETASADDPFVGFAEVRPLFELDGSTGQYTTAPSRRVHFKTDSFSARKSPHGFRIFCLGGSTVQGRPYSIETSFTTWLELSLQAADPSRTWEVVNCGGVSYASYRLAPILEEVLQYEPDLLIIYTGHNEFLEDRTYAHLKQPGILAQAHASIAQLRTFRLARSAWSSVFGERNQGPESRPLLPAEVDALLDYRGGLEDYHRDDAWRSDVVHHFRFNLHRMIRAAESAGVPVVLVNPVSNLKDCPPFKIEPRRDLTGQQRERFDKLWRDAQSLGETGAREAIPLLEQALAIDDRHAGVHFLLGKCFEALGRHDEAKRAFVRAKDEDICPLRAIEPLHDAIIAAAHEHNVPLIDVRSIFERLSPHGIPGDELLIDHVHPTVTGHQHIAQALIDHIFKQKVVVAQEDWTSRRKKLYRAHLESLNPAYFERGRQQLEGLRRWTEGRAEKIRSGPSSNR